MPEEEARDPSGEFGLLDTILLPQINCSVFLASPAAPLVNTCPLMNRADGVHTGGRGVFYLLSLNRSAILQRLKAIRLPLPPASWVVVESWWPHPGETHAQVVAPIATPLFGLITRPC